jgi:RNA polymerase sigma-70 factor, ECF subfamily
MHSGKNVPRLDGSVPPGVHVDMSRPQRSTPLARPEPPDADGVESFEGFFEAERRRLFRALFLMTGSVQEAEELTQDAFLRLWERWDRVRGMEDPSGYLYRTALNTYRSRLRRMLRATRATVIGPRPNDPIALADSRDAIVRAVRRLAPRQRAALILADLLDLSYDTAAELLGVKQSTVRNLVSQARFSLKRILEGEDE